MKDCMMDKGKGLDGREKTAMAEALMRLPEIMAMMDMMRPEREMERGDEGESMEHERGEMRGPGMMVVTIEKADKKKGKGKGKG